MGFRTVIMLNNDYANQWRNDPALGRKIARATSGIRPTDIENYGSVVECVHADTQTLVRLYHYSGFEPLAYTMRRSGPSTNEDKLSLLICAAEEMGYMLVKKGMNT